MSEPDEFNLNFQVSEGVWTALVGQFILNFGYIEQAVNHLLAVWTPSAVGKYAKDKMMLSGRLEMLGAVADDQSLPTAQLKILKENLKEVEDLVKYRNLLAHNPLSLYINFVGDNREVTEQIRSMKKPDQLVTKVQLREHTIRVKKAARALQQNMIEIRGTPGAQVELMHFSTMVDS